MVFLRSRLRYGDAMKASKRAKRGNTSVKQDAIADRTAHWLAIEVIVYVGKSIEYLLCHRSLRFTKS